MHTTYRLLHYENRLHDMEMVLLNNEPVSFLPFFKQSVVYGLQERVMQTLDDGKEYETAVQWNLPYPDSGTFVVLQMNQISHVACGSFFNLLDGWFVLHT